MSVTTVSPRRRRCDRGLKGGNQDAGPRPSTSRKLVARLPGVALICLAILVVPTRAGAIVPRPDPPFTVPPLKVSFAIYALEQDYRHASLAEKRGIHNEILLLTNVGSPVR